MSTKAAQKAKWHRLRNEIIKRPFLAYKIGLTSSEVESFCSDIMPSNEKIEEVAVLLQKERLKSIERLRPTLVKAVGNRGSVQFADKIDTDGMTIKYIIDGNIKRLPSHDLISRIENHLSYLTDFEVSIENLNDEKIFLANKVDGLRLSILKVISSLNGLDFLFDELKLADKKHKKSFGSPTASEWKINELQRMLNNAVTDLEKIRLEVQLIVKDYTE